MEKGYLFYNNNKNGIPGIHLALNDKKFIPEKQKKKE